MRVFETSISVDQASVSSLLLKPVKPRACYVLAHGAGAGMAHPFMDSVARELCERSIATLRYQFVYMEQGGKRPDPPKLAHAVVRAAIAKAGELLPEAPLIAGGKSFGGRMTSQAQSLSPLAGVSGLAFLGFPLHAAGQASDARAAHLFDVRVPMLFVQGTRDALADMELVRPLVKKLGARATLHAVDDADHSFHVPAKSGRKDAEVRGEFLDAFVAWVDGVIG